MTRYDDLASDINRYLSGKFPNAEEATAMEVSEYISNRVSRFLMGAIEERDREWRQSMKSQERHFDKMIATMRRTSKGKEV